MKKVLVGLIVAGNIVVWGLAYIGFSHNAESKTSSHDAKASKPHAADVKLGYFNVKFDGAEKRQPLFVSIKLNDSRNFKKLCRVKPQLQRNFYKLINRYPPRVEATHEVVYGRLGLRLVAEANKLAGKNTIAVASMAQDQLSPSLKTKEEMVQIETFEIKNCPPIEKT